ncbi:MAG: hypothetical protein HY675_01145 [Chloroflexi bacterium]|nr:hypothetical protein [Chloroflexota bacterium]
MLRNFTVILVVLASLAVGCKTADENRDSTTIKTKGGEQVTIGSRVPEELRKFAPPDGFQFESGVSSSSGGIAMGSWKGRGNVETVLDFYRKSMTGQGWTEAGFLKAAGQNILMYKKGDDATNITVSQKGDEVNVEIMSGPAAKNQ